MATRSNVTVSLTPKLKEYVEKKVSKGGYQSTSEVIREGLRLLQEKESDDQARRRIRNDIEIGWQQAAKGQLIDADDAYKHLMKRAAKVRKRAG